MSIHSNRRGHGCGHGHHARLGDAGMRAAAALRHRPDGDTAASNCSVAVRGKARVLIAASGSNTDCCASRNRWRDRCGANVGWRVWPHAAARHAGRLTRVLTVGMLSICLLAACRDPAADAAVQQAQAAAQAAANEQAAKENADGFDAAVAKQDWRLARAQADILLEQFPRTQAAERVRARYDEIKAKSDAAREQQRTAALWSYDSIPAGRGTQRSAAIYAREAVDTDGSGKQQVRLIFRDHPEWGKSSYLVLQAGDFACYGGCKVEVRIDDAPPKQMAALRPKTDEAIAMFINDERALWRMTRGAKTLAVVFPVKAGGTRIAVFEVAGLERSKLPGWD